MKGDLPVKCALWLNKRRVHCAAEIPENLDVASLRGYFIAGSLVDWLRENGGQVYADELSRLSADDPHLNEKIANIFGGKTLGVKSFGDAAENCGAASAPLCGTLGAFGSSGIFVSSGLSSYSFLGSFGPGSFGAFEELWRRISSGGFGSFGSWNYLMWEWLFSLLRRRYGSYSFAASSRFFGSGYWEWEWEWLFRAGSFTYGSFGSFPFGMADMFGSFVNFPILDEYDRIMFETLMICPLDRFGYGIHNV